ncbi:MAG TPA: type II toxin-antitoxin system VapC family toxin [Acetobacteraceae bacterium]|nr:type II toxin-antitoxin system VapC family toxin [Acetobacteraceae bacterium]
MIRVVDASAVAAMLFGEPDGPWVHALISGQLLFVPSIFHFELGNTCRMKSRRHPDKADALLTAWSDWNVQPPVTALAIDLTTTMERSHLLRCQLSLVGAGSRLGIDQPGCTARACRTQLGTARAVASWRWSDDTAFAQLIDLAG